jgi:hypothetical protein
MASTSSSLSTPATVADNSKEVAAFAVTFAAGAAGAAQTMTPAAPMDAVDIVNNSSNYIRATLVLSAGITSAIPAAQRVRLVAPNSAHTVDLAAHAGDAAAGKIAPIAGVSVAPVVAPAAGAPVEVSTLALTSAAQTQAGTVIVNFLDN